MILQATKGVAHADADCLVLAEAADGWHPIQFPGGEWALYRPYTNDTKTFEAAGPDLARKARAQVRAHELREKLTERLDQMDDQGEQAERDGGREVIAEKYGAIALHQAISLASSQGRSMEEIEHALATLARV